MTDPTPTYRERVGYFLAGAIVVFILWASWMFGVAV